MGNILSPRLEIPLKFFMGFSSHFFWNQTRKQRQKQHQNHKTQVNFSNTNHATSGMKSCITFENCM